MKKILTSFLAFVFILSCATAFAVPPRHVVRKKRAKKIIKQIVKNKKKQAILRKKLKKVVKPLPPGMRKPLPPGMQRPGPMMAPPPKRMERKGPLSFTEAELGAGYLAGIPAVLGALRFHNPFGMVSSSIKTGIAYATGKDADSVDRKHALVFVDAIYRMAPMFQPGIKPYVGIGINLVAYTTGRKTGAFDGQAYLGLEGKMSRRNSAYLEIGYGLIRTGISPIYKGLHAVVGVKTRI